MTVAEHQHLKQLTIEIFYLLVGQAVNQIRLFNVQVRNDAVSDLLLLALGATQIEVWLKRGLVVECHCSEARSLKVEVKFLVFFRVVLIECNLVSIFRIFFIFGVIKLASFASFGLSFLSHFFS